MKLQDWKDIEKKIQEGISINKKNKLNAEDGIEEGEWVIARIREKIKTFK